jgi:hexosaminidase
LYSDFIARISRIVLAHGRTPIVWEGFPIKGAERIPRETIVIAWESHYHLPKDLLDEGFRIINAAWQPLYIVASLVRRWYAKDILQWNVYNWQHWWSESAATFNPINVTPTENVLGAEICAWGCTFEQEIGLVMENLAALSERTWNVMRRSDLNEMLENMEQLLKLASRLIA